MVTALVLVCRDLMVVPYRSIDYEQHNAETGTEGFVTFGGSDYTIVRFLRLEGSGEILGTN